MVHEPVRFSSSTELHFPYIPSSLEPQGTLVVINLAVPRVRPLYTNTFGTVKAVIDDLPRIKFKNHQVQEKTAPITL